MQNGADIWTQIGNALREQRIRQDAAAAYLVACGWEVKPPHGVYAKPGAISTPSSAMGLRYLRLVPSHSSSGLPAANQEKQCRTSRK